MISKYIKPQGKLDDIDPVLNVDLLKNNDDSYWQLYTSQYQNWVWKDDIFCNSEISKIIKIGKYLNPQRAETFGNGEDCLDHRRSFVSWININSETQWIYKRLTSHILMVNDKWYNFDLEKIERLQFTYYNSEEQGCYKAHVDPMIWEMPHNRKLSFVMQLSDPSEYEGGELKLHLGNIPDTVEKRKGLAVFFPSYLLHEVTPVTKGERYSLVAWVHGKPFK
jgi:PKHD-type hydroxylase